ncbi:MAG TPA: ABC transporter substrate-binding protein [Thermodesulfobacteriota bacterium]|nr:ABC transporter substrate-binding protein [Thermodesulfobacteriota bacterium]
MRKGWLLIIMSVFLFSPVVGSRGTAGAAEPIKIGYMAPYVGVFAKFGSDLRDGFKFYLDEVGNKAAGRQIIFIDEDSEGKPEVGLVKAKKLVEKDRVHILAGIISSGVAYAVRDYVTEKKIPLVITNAGATKLTQEQRSPFIFRTSFANGQQDRAGGWYAYAKMGARKVIMIGSDYAAGHEKGDGFKKTFTFMGGEIVEEIYPPLGTNDFAPYLAKIANYVGKVDRVWAFFAGSDAIRFVNQYQEYGLKEKLKLFCEEGVLDEANLPSQQDAALGIESYARYCIGYDSPENKRFVAEYRKKYRYDPGALSEGGYVGAKFIVKALEAVKGNIENQDAFLKALRGVKIEAPRGPVRFDEYQNVIFNTFIERVEKAGGKYNNVVVDIIPNVDQYWMPKK